MTISSTSKLQLSARQTFCGSHFDPDNLTSTLHRYQIAGTLARKSAKDGYSAPHKINSDLQLTHRARYMRRELLVPAKSIAPLARRADLSRRKSLGCQYLAHALATYSTAMLSDLS
jgi:hypothetical protein